MDAVEYFSYLLFHVLDLLQFLCLALGFIRGPLALRASPCDIRQPLRQFLLTLSGKASFKLFLYQPVYDQVGYLLMGAVKWQ